MNRQRRSINLPVELRSVAGQETISGYAAVFYDPGDPATEFVHPHTGVRERLARGAFDGYLENPPSGRGVAALFNHNPDKVLGRWPGTLTLGVDQRGLHYSLSPPDTETGREVASLLRRGDIPGSSFSFDPGLVTREISGGQKVRTIRNFKAIYDVGPVVEPAYMATTSIIAARAEWCEDDENAQLWDVVRMLQRLDADERR